MQTIFQSQTMSVERITILQVEMYTGRSTKTDTLKIRSQLARARLSSIVARATVGVPVDNRPIRR